MVNDFITLQNNVLRAIKSSVDINEDNVILGGMDLVPPCINILVSPIDSNDLNVAYPIQKAFIEVYVTIDGDVSDQTAINNCKRLASSFIPSVNALPGIIKKTLTQQIAMILGRDGHLVYFDRTKIYVSWEALYIERKFNNE
jgi:hypothetical protein